MSEYHFSLQEKLFWALCKYKLSITAEALCWLPAISVRVQYHFLSVSLTALTGQRCRKNLFFSHHVGSLLCLPDFALLQPFHSVIWKNKTILLVKMNLEIKHVYVITSSSILVFNCVNNWLRFWTEKAWGYYQGTKESLYKLKYFI